MCDYLLTDNSSIVNHGTYGHKYGYSRLHSDGKALEGGRDELTRYFKRSILVYADRALAWCEEPWWTHGGGFPWVAHDRNCYHLHHSQPHRHPTLSLQPH